MNSIDNRKNIWEQYKQGFFLSFRSARIEEKFKDFLKKESWILRIIAVGLMGLVVFRRMNFGIEEGNLAYDCLVVLVCLLAMYLKRFQLWFEIVLFVTFEIKSNGLDDIMIFIEFIHALSSGVPLVFYLVMIIIKYFFLRSMNRVVDYFCAGILLVLLKKDLKDFWALKEYYFDMILDIEKTSNEYSSGFLIINESGEIVDSNISTIKFIAKINKDSGLSHISQIFSKETEIRLYSMLDIAKKGLVAEEEFLFLFKSSNKFEEFNSISLRTLPITVYGNNLFLLILKDISRQIAFRSIIVTNAKINQKMINTFESRFTSIFVKDDPLSEDDINFLLDYFFRQQESGLGVDLLMCASEIKFTDFDVKAEILNIIHVSWSNWKSKNIKVNLVIDKDIPFVKADKIKHNQLLRIILEYSLFHMDDRSDLLLTIGRTSLMGVQYRFKFYSKTITQGDIDNFMSHSIKMPQGNSEFQGRSVNMCSNLIGLLKGTLEEAKLYTELKKVIISYVLNLDKGKNCRRFSRTYISYPKDATVITWPPSVLPKRTNLSIAKVRALIKSSKTGSNPNISIVNSTSHESILTK